MNLTHTYSVPAIDGTSCRREFVEQVANACEYLEYLSQDLFNRIALRLNMYREEMDKLNECMQHADTCKDLIRYSKQAIQVHSSSRYVVDKKRSTYKSIFEQETLDGDSRSVELKGSTIRVAKKTDQMINSYGDSLIGKRKGVPLLGLGKPSANMKSVISFLKCNTRVNPYIQSTTIDPLNVDRRARKQIHASNHSDIEEVSSPHFNPFLYKRPTLDDPRYIPASSYAPHLSLPDDLPELNTYTTIDYQPQQQQIDLIATSSKESALPNEEHVPVSVTITSNDTEAAINVTYASTPTFSLAAALIEETEAIVGDITQKDIDRTTLPVLPKAVVNNSITETQFSVSQKPDNIHFQLVEAMKRRRELTRGKPSSSAAEQVSTTPSTGDRFVDGIIAKARDYRREKPDSESDSSDGSEWSP